MYLVGEALIGEGAELAHIDLLLGNKEGPVGNAFANAVSQLSMGHTPLLAVVRPNLLTKPATVIIPKVTLKGMEQVNEMFGPVQAAVAKAVADSLEEGVFANVDIEEIAIIASAFVHPDARDYNRIYRYNYGATKLALRRALEKFPDEKTLVYEKDRAAHGIMGFKVQRLWDPPYLQVAMDLVDMGKVAQVLKEVPQNDHVIIEAGTPLIKKFGLGVIGEIRKSEAQRVHHRGPEDPRHRQPRSPDGGRRHCRRGRRLGPRPDLHDREGDCGSPQGRHLLDHRYAQRAEPGKAHREAQGEA